MTTSFDQTTIADAAKLWLARCELEQLERATLHSYRSHVKHHIEPKIGDLLLNELSAVHVRDFLDSMLRDSTRAMAKKCLTSLRSIISGRVGLANRPVRVRGRRAPTRQTANSTRPDSMPNK